MPCLRVISFSAALTLMMLSTAGADEAYKLGPQDRLEVKVSDLRLGTGESSQWSTFYPGEFLVAPSGLVSLPIVGELPAAGKTTSELSALIATELKAKAHLADTPDASVQVVRFRPFYLMGSVAKPGEYDYRPGLTVLQAVSIAGGFERLSSDIALGLARDAVSSRGDLRVLMVDRVAYLIQQARLNAEVRGAASFALPAELKTTKPDPDVTRIMNEEKQLFDARRSAHQARLDALVRSKDFLQSEITSLTIKDVTSARQINVSKQELSQVAGLLARGLTVKSRQTELEQTTSQNETNRIDVQLALMHAREDLSKAQRDIDDLANTRRKDALQEAGEVRTKLAETAEKIATAHDLITQSEQRAPAAVQADEEANAQPSYFLTRRVNGMSQTLTAREDDPVQPGDVVRIVPKGHDRPAGPAQADAPDKTKTHARSASTF